MSERNVTNQGSSKINISFSNDDRKSFLENSFRLHIVSL